MSVERILGNGMTASDLIERLQDMPEDAIVFFTVDYGDHCHTMQALPIDSVDEHDASELKESAYSHSGVEFIDGVDAEDDEWYCEECDEMGTEGKCPKCNVPCVNEAGEKFNPDAPAKQDKAIIILGS